MRKGFVFGKFLPFHKGHEALIQFASSTCDLLTVLVCCSDKETVAGTVRENWIKKTFAGRAGIEVRVFHYDERELPNTSVSSREVSQTWAKAFQELVSDYAIVISSEPYGELVAEYMGIEHIPFDPGRQEYPVSGTAIRNDLAGNWKYLPDCVKEDLIVKVVILGTESTGKTTMTRQLASHFDCSSVMEAGRDLIEDSREFTMDDLYLVAATHAEAISRASRGDSPLLIIDTDIHITLSYASFTFGQLPEFDREIYRLNAAGLYLYLNKDVPYVQDGTRLEETERNRLDASHRKILRDNHIRFEEISGDWEERWASAVSLIEKMLGEARNIKS